MLSLIPWRRNRPTEVSTLQHQVNRLFEDFFALPDLWRDLDRERGMGFMPAVDVRETEKEVLVDAELPGIDPTEVELHIESGALHLCGERRREEEQKADGVCRVERYHGRFERYLPLPDSIDANDVNAEYKNGVLKVRIGKRPDAAPRKIAIAAA